ncbi:hypothetical protein SPRG_12740 [Saprolegnia parasitica CBS 223.65]|uniref:Uncharacterized protein n=1 Tax=Saprolegnia parasitica (strain CBS 223.65) TaxID=695850 RepID=A0A067BV85_SAPPC|nr:hypothetical protein SPRG_12740 [Saprolegnia parasitica CBS 223.65]KDO22459.1 hypothetical protein SPRG_12740 [Saprolegnia parasitica CBS 223.65]|eukprot:XP_012206847.1 hypothetical protein SPRG_12740 [Saprolegnia parasitica CBS 223.65]
MCDEIIMGCCAAIFCSSGSSNQASKTTRPVDDAPVVPIVVSPVPVVATAVSTTSPSSAATKDEGASSSTIPCAKDVLPATTEPNSK